MPATADSAAERLLREADGHRESGARDAALDSYLLLVRQFPEDPKAATALLSVLDLYRGSDERLAAKDTIERLLSDYPRSPEAAAAFVARGELETEAARDQEALGAARTTFRRVPLLFSAADFPNLEARVRARVRSAEIGLTLGDTDGAIVEAIAAIDDEPPSRWTGSARWVLGRALLADEQLDAAVEVLQRLVDDRPVAPPEGGLKPLLAAVETSRADDRLAARRLLSLIHRHLLRPVAGERRWRRTERFPAAGLALREPTGVAAAQDGRVLIVDAEESVSLVDAAGAVLGSRPVEDAVRPSFADG
ncbi:MAG: tetratricopeptide repeat protein, partial [Acidobacteriota bacterium]